MTLLSCTYVRHGSLDVPARAERAYETAKRYLGRDAIERGLFHRLEHARGRHFLLRVNDRNDDSFDPVTGTIAWDPHSAMRTSGGGTQSPALGLGHEVAHAVEVPGREARLASKRCARFDNAEERRVILGSERHAARTLGEATRDDHWGRCFRVRSPVAR
jgi:hypothetical protein